MKVSPKRTLASRPFTALLGILWLAPLAASQSSAPAPKPASTVAPAKAPDYSQEPFIFEQYTTKVRFENDGTGERTNYIARIHTRRSAAGVHESLELTFGYNSGSDATRYSLRSRAARPMA